MDEEILLILLERAKEEWLSIEDVIATLCEERDAD